MLTAGQKATVVMEMINWCDQSPDQGVWPNNFLEFLTSGTFEVHHGPIDLRDALQVLVDYYDQAQKCADELVRVRDEYKSETMIRQAETIIGASIQPVWGPSSKQS